MNRQRLLKTISGEKSSPHAALARGGLSVLTPPYRAAIAARNVLFDLGVRYARHLLWPVISVGNITTGGTGKTPFVAELARRLTRMGAHPGVLLRGYRSRPDPADPTRLLSDEAADLTSELGTSVPVKANPDRALGARQMLEQHPQVRVFLLDDGFQHRRIYRDLDIVLIDATCPFGYDRLLPRGLLREPARNLRRADIVIVTRADQVDAARLADIDRRIEELTGRPPAAHTVHHWSGFRSADGREHAPDALGDLPVLGACGIGNPDAFIATLHRMAGRVVRTSVFADHHHYTAFQLDALFAEAERSSAILVTTEKDWVKWEPRLKKEPPVQVFRPVLRIEFLDGDETIDRLLTAAAG